MMEKMIKIFVFVQFYFWLVSAAISSPNSDVVLVEDVLDPQRCPSTHYERPGNLTNIVGSILKIKQIFYFSNNFSFSILMSEFFTS